MIETHRISTAMGKLTSASELPYLSEEERLELDKIGYTGKNSAGVPTTREEFLNSLGKGEFRVEQTGFDDGTFCEKFVVFRCYQA